MKPFVSFSNGSYTIEFYDTGSVISFSLNSKDALQLVDDLENLIHGQIMKNFEPIKLD